MFTSTDAKGFPVYHTNVMMAIGTDVAVVCAESVPDDKERAHLLAALRRHHQVCHAFHGFIVGRPGTHRTPFYVCTATR